MRDLRAATDLLKTELLESQSTVIKIQSEQWECNREQFQSLQTTVKSTVQETMQSEMKSYSSDLTEKPSFLALRVGKKSASKARPVKVTLTGNGSVNQILMKARRLRTVEAYKPVFLSPDRSPDERTQHRQLILDLKQKVAKQPDKKHFIRQGQIITTEKP